MKATYGTGSSVMAPVNSAQCDIATLATTIARHDGENIIYGLEGNIPTPAMPWHGWLTAPV